jgi:purine-binding chemotaxis protein CheW
MDYETYDDDRPTDRADDLESGDEAADHGAFAEGSVFEAPDLATAFLAALDAVDDRAFVSPPLDPPPSLDPEPLASEPESVAPEPVVSAPVAPELVASEPTAFPLEQGTLALVDAQPAESEPVSIDPVQTVEAADAAAAAEEAPQALYAAPSIDDYVIEHEDPAPTIMIAAPGPAPSDAAVAEAFAAEQAALELWGSDEAAAEPTDDLDAETRAAIQAEIEAEAAAQATASSGSQTDLVLETVSNQDSYYDPDTLRLARPLFSPDEPRAFAGPVYVGDAATAESEGAQASIEADAEAEVLEDLEEFVAFSLGETRCVVPIRNVIEIGRIPDAVGVPNAPAWLHGLGNLRGQVLSLIDLRAFLGIGRVRPATGRMLVLRADDDEVQAGLLVDHVHQIVSLSATRFHPVPETLPQHYARVAWGVCEYGNFTMIGLEVDNLLGVEAMAAEEAEAL